MTKTGQDWMLREINDDSTSFAIFDTAAEMFMVSNLNAQEHAGISCVYTGCQDSERSVICRMLMDGCKEPST